MAKPTETRAPAGAAKSPAAARRTAPSGNGRAPRSPTEARGAPRPPSGTASASRVKEIDVGSAPGAEPPQTPNASATEVSAGPEAVSAAPEPRPQPSAPAASEDRGVDRLTVAANEVPPGLHAEPDHHTQTAVEARAEPPEDAAAPADRPTTPRPGRSAAEQAATLPLAWLEGPARLGDEMAGFARAQIEDAIATAHAILTCGSLPKAIELQASYALRALQGNVAQAVRLARLSAELMPVALTPRKPS